MLTSPWPPDCVIVPARTGVSISLFSVSELRSSPAEWSSVAQLMGTESGYARLERAQLGTSPKFSREVPYVASSSVKGAGEPPALLGAPCCKRLTQQSQTGNALPPA